jgi:hypothetical protein
LRTKIVIISLLQINYDINDMNKIIKYLIYISILLVYNLTTVYAAVTHNHDFSWKYEESCPAYIISISHFSDTFIFSTDNCLKFPKTDIINFLKYDSDLNFEFISLYSERAPPSFL